ncbi:MAG: SPOR domain-containing protein [Pseudomonadota bacterium]
MADFAYSQSEMDAAEEIDSGGLQALINVTGGLVSIVLIAGLVAWGWQLMVRDVSGVPVVEALQGPMRIEPADPGGSQADHQGLAVNRIAEGQEAAPAADAISLAPPPVDLAEIEFAPLPADPEPIETAPEPVARAIAPDETVPADASSPSDVATSAPTPEAAAEATLALIDRLATEEQEAQAPEVGQPSFEGSLVGDRIEVLPISIAGLRSSLLPSPRPAALERAAETITQTSAASTEPQLPAEIDPETLTPGTRLVQLGAFDDAREAEAEWDRLAAAFPDFFVARSRIVQQALSGGRAFFRLRAHGFEDLMDARRFCTALLAEGAACIPVTVR